MVKFVNENRKIRNWYNRELVEINKTMHYFNYVDTPENRTSFTIKHRKELIYIMELLEKINRIQEKEPF